MAVSPPPPPPPPRRIRIVGTSGSGKTALARAVGERAGLAHLELDAVFWDAGWSRREAEEALALIRGFVDGHPDGWVVDGNWTSSLGGLLDPGAPRGADVVVWIDHPRRVVMRRIIVRTVARGILRQELWHGNRERPADWLRWEPERNIMRWAWTSHPRVRARMLRRIAAGEPVVRLRGQREVNAWLDALSEGARTVYP